MGPATVGSMHSRPIPSALEKAAPLPLPQGAYVEIWVAEGTYHTPLVIPSLVRLYGGFSKIETSVEQRDLQLHATYIEPDASLPSPPLHMIELSDVSYARIDGFIIRNCQSTR